MASSVLRRGDGKPLHTPMIEPPAQTRERLQDSPADAALRLSSHYALLAGFLVTSVTCEAEGSEGLVA